MRVPDVMVLAEAPGGCRVTDPPLVVVEVLAGNGQDDLIVRSGELQGGASSCGWSIWFTGSSMGPPRLDRSA